MGPGCGGVVGRLLEDGGVEGRRGEATSGAYLSMAEIRPPGRAPEVVREAGGTKIGTANGSSKRLNPFLENGRIDPGVASRFNLYRS